VDEVADLMSGSPSYLEPRELITENTDHRSMHHFPPHLEENNQQWYEEPVQETTMGWPVVRAPHPFKRWREGLRLKKSTPEQYPFIQDFKNHYDVLIVGGGMVGSMIAFMLTSKVETKTGVRVGIIEKDPSYRHGLTNTSPFGIRLQHGLPENIEAALFGADFYRNLALELSVAAGTEDEEDYLNVPRPKLQPHGHLTLAGPGQMEALQEDHTVQTALGVQSALLTVKQLELRFPWLNTTGVAGGCLGLEAEGWMDTWNLVQSVKLRNISQGVDYIHGEVVYIKRHMVEGVEQMNMGMGMGRFEDGSEVPLAHPYECHVLLPGQQKVYPIEYSQCIIAAGGESGNIGRLAGIGDGTGMMAVPIPVERRRQYVYQVLLPPTLPRFREAPPSSILPPQ
jgi:FAD-dependent oxidoreductase domain-containing protein 1